MIDSIDSKILDILQKDASIPISEIAKMIGSSKSVCWRRIQKLTDDGVIKKRVVLLDPKKAGIEFIVFAQVRMLGHSKSSLLMFAKRVLQYPQVIECYAITGNADFMLKIAVKNMEEYEYLFWNKLSRLEGVQEINSSITVTEVKHTTQLPLLEKEYIGNDSNIPRYL